MLNSAGLLAFLCWLCIATEYVQAAPYTATLSDFGTRGDGISDDSDPIRDAFAHIPVGAVLDGENKSYRVTGTFQIRRDLTMRNAAFLQQSPQGDTEGPRSVRTLLIRGEPSQPIRVVLERVKVHRGDNPHQGSPGDAAGIWMDNVVDSRLSNVEITGNEPGVGLLLAEANNVEVHNIWVHDVTWAPCLAQVEDLPWDVIRRAWNSYHVVSMDDCTVPGPARVRIQGPLSGLVVVRSRNVRIIDPVIERLYAHFADGRRLPWQTDSIGIGTGSVDSSGEAVPSDISIKGARISRVWEGIDIAGHPVRSVRITNATIDRINAFGIKVANGAADVLISMARVENSGLAGFVISGKNLEANLHPSTHQVHIQDSQAINTGSNGYWIGQATIAGFRLMRGRVSGPVGVWITRSQANDEQKVATMQFGFHSECRDSLTLDESVARGYTAERSRIEYYDCAEKTIQPKSLKSKTY